MTKTKWHSKLLSLSIAFALVFSLVAMVVPVNTVEAQGAVLDVDVSTENSTYCCCDVFNVTAVITETGTSENATGVNATLTITGDAEIGLGTLIKTDTISCGNITANSTATVSWEVHCTGGDPATFTVTATGDNTGAEASGSTEVTQEEGWLEVFIVDPAWSVGEDPPQFSVCTVYNVTFYIQNMSETCEIHYPFAQVSTSSGIEIVENGSDFYQTGPLAVSLLPGQITPEYTLELHCVGTGLDSIEIRPIGTNPCDLEIHGDTDNLPVEQIFGVTCNVTPNPTKVGHNVTFTANVGTEAVLDLDYVWNFGDGNTATGTDYGSHTITEIHMYDTPGNYTAMCQVTDASGIIVNCTGTVVVVYPVLGVNCTVRTGTVATHEMNYYAKTDTLVCFNATRVGGLESPCYDGTDVSYSWFWDFGDGTNSTAQNPCHTYNVTNNYTATVTLTDDCLLNEASCNKTIQISDELWISCNATPLETKASDDPDDEVDFSATVNGGLPTPPADYTWKWDFGDGDSETGCGSVANASHQYATGGENYTAVVQFWDNTAINNTATCNKTIYVFPSLNVTCDVTPDPQNVCHAVNFTAERDGGVPGNAYNWTWEFENADTHEVVGTAVGQNVTWTFMCVGNYTGTVTLEDTVLGNTANCTANVTIIIEPPELITPGNGVTVNSNMVCYEWEDIGCCNYTLEVWQKDGLAVKVWLVDTGKDAFWCGPIMDGNYRWRVTATDACNNTAVSEDWFFGVQESAIAVTVTSPNGGEVLSANGTAAITWDAAYTDRYAGGFASSQDDLLATISYSADSGGTWTEIAADEPNDGVYAWTVPMVDSDQCLVMVEVSDALGNDGVDTSDAVFTIEMAATPTASIDLAAGWNLISLPLIPTNSTIESVMAGLNVTLVYHYDPTVPKWFFWNGTPAGDLTDMVDGLGYWVFMGSPGTMTVVGTEMPVPPCPTCPPPAPPTYEVVAGWNMIGVKSTTPVYHGDYLMSVSGEYSVLYAYDAATGSWTNVYPVEQNGGIMEPGYGFWLWMNSAGTIVP